jgi:3-isopropylmalate/(R)-2-methylmalate dehydratase small subunit
VSTARIAGLAYWCGDFVNTDVISPGRFEPYEGPEQLARIALIDHDGPVPFVDPALGRSRYTVIVAGEEFGCGSGREQAPQALYHAGARAVVARSFARIFFRNCVNMGLLLPIRCAHGFGPEVQDAPVVIDCAARRFSVAGVEHPIPDFGPLTAIIEAGGLTTYTKRRLAGERA